MEAHGEDLREVSGDDALVEAVKRGETGQLPERSRLLLELADVVTNDAHHMTREQVAGFRSRGLSDEDILNAVQVIGFFNYYNRMADALGIEPEDFMPPRYPI